MKSPTYITDCPHMFHSALAMQLSLNGAIVFQKLVFLLSHPNNGKEIDGTRWIYNTSKEWREQFFPFWSENTIERIFTGLEAAGMIHSRQFDGSVRRKYYTITDAAKVVLNTNNLPSPAKAPDWCLPKHQIGALESTKLVPSYNTSMSTKKTVSKSQDVSKPKLSEQEKADLFNNSEYQKAFFDKQVDSGKFDQAIIDNNEFSNPELAHIPKWRAYALSYLRNFGFILSNQYPPDIQEIVNQINSRRTQMVVEAIRAGVEINFDN